MVCDLVSSLEGFKAFKALLDCFLRFPRQINW